MLIVEPAGVKCTGGKKGVSIRALSFGRSRWDSARPMRLLESFPTAAICSSLYHSPCIINKVGSEWFRFARAVCELVSLVDFRLPALAPQSQSFAISSTRQDKRW